MCINLIPDFLLMTPAGVFAPLPVRPNITVMADWALKTNISICLLVYTAYVFVDGTLIVLQFSAHICPMWNYQHC